MAARKTKFEARITGRGHTHDGREAFTVSSQSVANLHHIVIVNPDKLECDCYYSAKLGKVCTHRTLVHDRLVAERAARAEKFAGQTPKATSKFAAPSHNSPALADDTRPFSIFK